MALELVASHACFGGRQQFYRHDSTEIGLPMRFSVYLPPGAAGRQRVPVAVYLAGLTCSEETFPAKAGAQRAASQLGLALLCPDTSPRGANLPGEADAWDFGVAAGFYLDAVREPWRRHWRIESYLMKELLPLAADALGVDLERAAILGHSMGGHGALTLALRRPGAFRSVSALAPVAAPMQCPWGVKAFTGYLGEERAAWAEHDATELMGRQASPPYPGGILVDQGLADKFLAEQLLPDRLEAACARVGQPLELRAHEGYDHSYYFVSTFIADHLAFHARRLSA